MKWNNKDFLIMNIGILGKHYNMFSKTIIILERRRQNYCLQVIDMSIKMRGVSTENKKNK